MAHASDINTDESTSKLTKAQLEQIILHSYDSIMVTDKFGHVLLANPAAAKFMGVTPDQLVGNKVEDLIKKGILESSTTFEARKKRTVVSGLVRTGIGVSLISTSTPIMDEHGEIMMVITNTRDKEVIDRYLEALEQERLKAVRYKTAVEYLSEVDLDPREPIAESQQMRQIMETSHVIAKTDSTVMLMGESGTGKEVMARYIHRHSLRSKEPFIPVNCAAIPHELIESELFGYAKGAFTGANSQGKPGLFEIADKGTLFLDEIGELPLALQSKLLRVLETGEIQRLGSTTIQQTNVRVIAATNRDLKAMIEQKLFRSDLYYRLHVIPVQLPPLNERPEDIVMLAYKFLEELNRKYGFKKRFTNQAIQELLNYAWPGNVRELRNVIERLVITSAAEQLEFGNDRLINHNLLMKHDETRPEWGSVYQADANRSGSLKSVLKAVEEQYIKQVLSECNGRIGEAADRLGIHRTMLYRKLKKDKQ